MPDYTDVPISSFPDAQSVDASDKVTGLKSGNNTNFSFNSILAWLISQFYAVFLPASSKGQAGGVASLDSTGKLPSDQMPTITPSDIGAQPTIIASGILKGDGAGGVSAAVAGTDYQIPLTAGTDYATPAQLADKANQAQLAYVESGATASRAYAVWEPFCWNGLLYRAITPVSVGQSFTPGTNCEQTTVGDALAFTIYTGTQATNTVPGTSYTVINAMSLPSGKYFIVGSASNVGNITGTLALTITNATAGENVVTNRTETSNGGGNTVCAIIELAVTSTIRLRATQTTGSSLSLNTNSLTAVKLA